MRNSFWGLIWSSFLEIKGFLIGFLGIILAIFLPRFPFNTLIPLDLFLIIGFFTLLFIATLFTVIYKIFQQSQKLQVELEETLSENQKLKTQLNQCLIPKVLWAKKQQEKIGLVILCLLEPSELFAIDMLISFYYTDEYDVEILIGVGTVETVQSNGRIKALLYPIIEHQEIIEKLANRDAKTLQKIMVKPGATRALIKSLLNKP